MKLTRLPIFFFQLAASVAGAQTVWHVDHVCVSPGAGTQINPFCTIQDGVDAAQDGDTVLVHPGTYTGDGNRDISVFGKKITLRSTDGPSATVLDIQGGPTSIHRGFFLIHGETNGTIVDGFTIMNAYLIGDTGGTGPGGGGGGGGFYIRDSSPTIRNCIIRDNISATLNPPFPVDGRGGGVYVDGGSSTIIQNCIIADNVAERRGGGINLIGDNANSATVQNCWVIGNSSGENYPGGGIKLAGGRPIVINTIIANNDGGGPGGGVHSEQSDAFLGNCILWSNRSGFGGAQIHIQSSRLTLEYSDVQGGSERIEGSGQLNWGSGNIDADPLFVYPEGGDYHLLPGSPCIDAGNNFALPANLLTDLDGVARLADDPDTPDTGNSDGSVGVVDMGPYEFGGDDCNNNGTPDPDDISKGTSLDCDANNVPDDCEPDCNGNGQADLCDIADGVSGDCNENLRPDACEIDQNSPAQGGPFYCAVATNSCDPDCNVNGVLDVCDINSETSEDCDINGVPDECDPDCNDNGEVDVCEIISGLADDCNRNLVPDECEVPLPITQQPQDQEVEMGVAFTFFMVQAEGLVLEYQWRKDGVALADGDEFLGTTADTLFVVDVQPEDAGSYDCEVTELVNECSTLSDPATLTVLDPCPADLDGDGFVNVPDLIILLGAWGFCADDCPADFDADGQVRVSDLIELLGTWGTCP